ncbi:hypothetical protein Tco_0144344 [Tanacetum coccineum]
MHHLASCLPFILHASCMVSYEDDLYKLLLVQVMVAPTTLVSAERNLGDPIEIRVDIVHIVPVDIFPAATVVRTLAQHREAIRGIHGHLQGVPINEEMSSLRFRMGMAEEENASLRGMIKAIEVTDVVTHRQEKRARIELERQLALVQESQRQDRENFRPKSKNAKVRVNTEESAVKPEPELKNTVGCNLNPSDGPGKPNSIFMKTVKTKWALNQLQQPICVQLTKTVKTLKAQS